MCVCVGGGWLCVCVQEGGVFVCVCAGVREGGVCGAYMRGTEGESLFNTFCLCLGRSSSSRGRSECVGDVSVCMYV